MRAPGPARTMVGMTDALDRRPSGVDDGTVAAVGKLSEAMEYVIRARGRFYDAHQLIGRADLLLDEAVDGLRAAGHDDLADAIRTDLIGRNVLPGRWTYQIMEEFDDGYYAAFTAADRRAREDVLGGRRHVFEAEMKRERRTPGRRGHDAAPNDATR
jgi:hypothetical protein